TCDVCSEKYALVRQDGQVIVVRRSELKAREDAGKRWSRLSREIEQIPTTKELLAEAERRLNDMPLSSAYERVKAASPTLMASGKWPATLRRIAAGKTWRRAPNDPASRRR